MSGSFVLSRFHPNATNIKGIFSQNLSWNRLWTLHHSGAQNLIPPVCHPHPPRYSLFNHWCTTENIMYCKSEIRRCTFHYESLWNVCNTKSNKSLSFLWRHCVVTVGNFSTELLSIYSCFIFQPVTWSYLTNKT